MLLRRYCYEMPEVVFRTVSLDLVEDLANRTGLRQAQTYKLLYQQIWLNVTYNFITLHDCSAVFTTNLLAPNRPG